MEKNENSPICLDPQAIVEFIDELRRNGYNIGLSQYIAVQDLILALAARGEQLDDVKRLRGFIGPLLCGSPSEQQDFQGRFDAWAKRFEAVPIVTESSGNSLAQALAVELEDIEKGGRWMRKKSVAVVGMIVAVLFVGLSLNNSIHHPRTSSVLEPNPHPMTNTYPTRTIELSIPTNVKDLFDLSWALLGIVLLAMAGLEAWRRRWWREKAELFLERRRVLVQPDLRSVSCQVAEADLFPPVVHSRIAQEFRRRVLVPSSALDVNRTITRTLQAGGWLAPVYLKRQVVPEYLVLLDRASFRDQQARLFKAMVDRLKEDRVLATVYWFRGDPRQCRAYADNGLSISLKELASQHAQDRLIIFSDGRGLLDPLTGQVANWTEIFTNWTDRALLTPAPKANWGVRHERLSEMFTVLPATTDGLMSLEESFRGRHIFSEPATPDQTAIPDELINRPQRWLGQDAPDEEHFSKVLLQLREHLNEDGYLLLSACAVYPEVNWNITLFLGIRLAAACGGNPLSTETLGTMGRLPWFRHGQMPDWLRLRLIEDLDRERETAIRQVLAELLLNVGNESKKGFPLEMAIGSRPELLHLAKALLRSVANRVPGSSPMQEHVFLDFMANRKLKRLVLRVPRVLWKILKGRGEEKRTWLRWREMPAKTWDFGKGLGRGMFSSQKYRTLGWALVGKWVLANLAGLAMGIAVLWLLRAWVRDDVFDGIICGLITGVTQSLVIRRSLLIQREQWILATVVGIILTFLTIGSHTNLGTFLVGVTIGANVGISQWFLLRGLFRGGLSWIAATSISFGVGSWAADSFSEKFENFLGDSGSVIGCMLLFSLAYSLTTGLMLKWIAARPLAEPPPPLRVVRPIQQLWLFFGGEHRLVSRGSLWWRWVAAKIIGGGFLFVISNLWSSNYSTGPASLVLLGGIVMGTLEGRILSSLVPMKPARWVWVTSTAGVVGIICFMSFLRNDSSVGLSIVLQIVLSCGGAWVLLRGYFNRAWQIAILLGGPLIAIEGIVLSTVRYNIPDKLTNPRVIHYKFTYTLVWVLALVSAGAIQGLAFWLVKPLSPILPGAQARDYKGGDLHKRSEKEGRAS